MKKIHPDVLGSLFARILFELLKDKKVGMKVGDLIESLATEQDSRIILEGLAILEKYGLDDPEPTVLTTEVSPTNPNEINANANYLYQAFGLMMQSLEEGIHGKHFLRGMTVRLTEEDLITVDAALRIMYKRTEAIAKSRASEGVDGSEVYQLVIALVPVTKAKKKN